MPDFEELVGVFTGDGEVDLVQKNNLSLYRLYVRALRAREANQIQKAILDYGMSRTTRARGK